MNPIASYPPAPLNVPVTLTEPSQSFKSEVGKVVTAIIAFIITYLLMVLLAAVLVWFCFKAGLIVMTLRFSVYTLLLGLGIMLMGGLVIFFLIKFLFASNKSTGEPGVRIYEEDEPELFTFIRKVADEVGTHFPQKIFLIPDVNASVFYNSSFLSLFFPSRKNLNIGLGLVNSLNLSEFKAVLAHEFGHFSQNSMRLGSYVYYVNQVIYNMLYRNDGWISAANGIAGIHQILWFFVRMAAYIVQGVQWVLRQMYGIINRQYLSLSREMEFHADTISASVSGSNNMSQALRQVELGSETYSRIIDKCNEMLQDKKGPLNAYKGQMAVAAHIASVNKLSLVEGVPVVSADFIARHQHQRVNVKNQWASHPTHDEREANLQSIGLDSPVEKGSAWSLFRQAEKWQHELTNFLYRNVEFRVEDVDDQNFVSMLNADGEAQEFPEIYLGYFDAHTMYTESLPEAFSQVKPETLTAAMVNEMVSENFDSKLIALQNDVNTLNMIAEGQIDTKSFDFDGKKYPKEEAGDIQKLLEKEIEQELKLRNDQDLRMAKAFYAQALTKSTPKAESLKNAYAELVAYDGLVKSAMPYANKILTAIHYAAANGYGLPSEIFPHFKQMTDVLVPELARMLREPSNLALLPAELQNKIKEVFDGNLKYFHELMAHQTNTEKLRDVVFGLVQFLQKSVFEKQKAVLVMQTEVL